MMDHREIEQNDVVERYVTGRLGPDELARFEAHYLGCATCCDAVEGAELLHEGLEQMAAEETVHAVRQSLLAAVFSRMRWPMAAVLMLAVALLPASLVWRENRRLTGDLDTAARTLAEERQPRINTPILTLAGRRGDGAVRQITLRREPEWIVLAVELPEPLAERYRVTLSALSPSPDPAQGGDSDSIIWQSSGLVPSFEGVLTLSLHSPLLPSGDYQLGIIAQPSGDARSFVLRVVQQP